jgi:hypothetical protein
MASMILIIIIYKKKKLDVSLQVPRGVQDL